MSENELGRIKHDLETIESAIGISRPWDPREVRINFAFAAAGTAATAWGLLVPGAWALLAFSFFVVPVTQWMLTAFNAPEKAHFVRRDFQSALRTCWLAIPLLALFVWGQNVGLPPVQFLGLATFLVGAVLFSAAVGERFEAVIFGWSLALMTGGLVLPLEIAPAVAVLSAALACGGLSSAILAMATRTVSSTYATH